jgi:hypothetical protein
MLKYPTYNQDLYVLVQAMKKQKHYPLGRETMIQIVAREALQADVVPTTIPSSNQVQNWHD